MSKMRNLSTPSFPGNTGRRGSTAGLVSALSSPNQSRYKGLISTPGYVKFSAWKRENEIQRHNFHDYILQKISEKDREKLWIKDLTNGRMETFGSVKSQVQKVASGLTKLGFKKGDVMTMYCSNYVEYWLLALGVWTCGGCIMPVNCELNPDDLELQMQTAKTKILVCDDFDYVDALDILENTNIISHLIVIGTEGRGQEGCINVSELTGDDGRSCPRNVNMDWEKDVIYMPFTSTSSSAKGIMHTNKSLMAQFFSPDGAANHWFDQLIGDSILCGNHFFHMTGLYNFALASIYGITMYVLSEYSDNAFLDALADTRVATATAYAWQIRMLSQSPSVGKYDLSTLKVLITGCGLLSSTIRMEVMDRIPSIKYVREAYGLNELGLVTLSYPREKKNSVASVKSVDLPDDHVMPVGLPNMYCMVKIINRESGNPVEGPEQQGEICVKTVQAMIGYLHQDSAKAFDQEGYFHTGDLGYYDSQGVIYFIEQIANLINFWMYEVAPSILESRLLGSNNIVDAAVVGIPDKENGQVPRAFVVLKPGFEETEENLTNLMESRLQDHERIRGGMYFVQNIPRDENWKVLRNVLAEYQPAKDSGTHVGAEIPPSSSKKVIQELEKQPNGSFLAPSGAEAETTTSPRVKRSAKTRDRGRRGSMDCIVEGAVAESRLSPGDLGSTSAPGGRRRVSNARGSRRGSMVEMTTPAVEGAITYWLQVSVLPETLVEYLLTHPAVDDAVVQGVHYEGIGELPRGYVVLKPGYGVTGEEILAHMNSRVDQTERLRGGIVLIDKLGRDPNGKLVVNLEKYDRDVVGLDEALVRRGRTNQPKVSRVVF